MTGYSFRTPLRFLRGSLSTSILSLLALASGVALVCASDLVSRAVSHAFIEVVDTMAGRASLQVTAGEAGLFSEAASEQIARLPGVELAIPVVSATAFVVDERPELVSVHAVDVMNDDALTVYGVNREEHLEIEDELVLLNQPNSIIVTRALADRHALQLGSALLLDTPVGRRSFTVRGLLRPTGIARVQGGALIVMDLYAAQQAFARTGFVHRVDIVLESTANVDRVRDQIAEQLPAGLRVDTPLQRKADLHRMMNSFQSMVRGVSLVGLIVAFLISFNRLGTVFTSRLSSIGIMRAVGITRRRVWLELMKEAIVLGALGAVIGIPLGVGLGFLILPIIAKGASLSYKLLATDPELAISGTSIAVATLLGIGSAVLAAAQPAARVSKWEALEILRGVRERKRSVRQGRVAKLTFPLVILAGVVFHVFSGSQVSGLIATVLIVTGIALSGPIVVRAAADPLLAGVRWMLGPIARLSARTFTSSESRTTLTVSMLGVGAAVVCWLWTLAGSFERSVVDALTPALASDLIVGSAHIESGAFEAPLHENLLSRLEQVPEVAGVAGERVVQWDYAGGPIVIEAFDRKYFEDKRFGGWPLIGRHLPDVWNGVASGTTTVISTNLASHLNLRVGDTIHLPAPNGQIDLIVGGVTLDFASPRGTIKLTREAYREAWNDDHITLALVNGRHPSQAASLRNGISALLANQYDVRILSSRELVSYYAEQVRKAFAGVDVLGALVLLVVLVGLADTLIAGVLEKRHELGTMRAVGVAARHVRRLVVVEAVVMAIAGLANALAGGLLLGVLWAKITFPSLLGWALELHIPYSRIAAGFALTLLVTIVAAVFPARQAGRLEPVAALRYE